MNLERPEFQRLLFRTAFCVMACDGEIAEQEKKVIREMNASSSYFQGIDLSNELEHLLSDLKVKGKLIVDELLETLTKLEISTVQELLILEIAFRIINADEKIDENEIKFVRYLRSKLKLHDEIIRDRFGVVEYLFDRDYSQESVKRASKLEFNSSYKIPEFNDLTAADISNIIEK